eukprot:2837736-Karenia_brevis.AAC.1
MCIRDSSCLGPGAQAIRNIVRKDQEREVHTMQMVLRIGKKKKILTKEQGEEEGVPDIEYADTVQEAAELHAI